jgi:Dehydrogenases with different specificities (related to short-chain alcohol dehydrogenases)
MTKVLSEEARQAAMSMIAMKRFASTDDIADLAVFLASDKSSYITGQVISVDGGMAM